MALRNQPYFPLYVQDVLTDEKLVECSAASIGIYIFIMCVMHKSKEYGTILLKQKDKQTPIQSTNFALKLVKHLPFTFEQIEKAIEELHEEEVLIMEGDRLIQKRMVKDNAISVSRSKAGAKGGKKTQEKGKFAKANEEAKDEASSENENESENESKNIIERNKQEISSSHIWIDQIAMKKKLEHHEVDNYLLQFIDDLELKGEMDKPLKDIKQHFVNWLNIKLKESKGTKEKKSITSNR
jgi:uncharacterized protein YdaU (DUF1376 family)